jgi:hypothetical protein
MVANDKREKGWTYRMSKQDKSSASDKAPAHLPLHGLPRDENEQLLLVEEFSAVIAACRGKVFFRTIDGDMLVADSMLSAIIGFKTLLDMADRVKLTFECELKEDEDRLKAFIRKHKLGN